jgi:hypothetical protein
MSVFDEPTTTTRGISPCTSVRSKIVLADGVKDVRGHGALSQGFDAMANGSGNPSGVAEFQNSGDPSDRGLEPARDHDTHLLVRMAGSGTTQSGVRCTTESIMPRPTVVRISTLG